MVGQLNPAYYDAAGKVIAATNPRVKAAWNLTMQAYWPARIAGLAAFSNDWNTGFKKGMFATVTCPAWMMGYIQGQAPGDEGQVGHRRHARHRRQLGRLVPRRPEAVDAQAGGRRPGQVPDLAGVARRTSSSRPATCPASRPC